MLNDSKDLVKREEFSLSSNRFLFKIDGNNLPYHNLSAVISLKKENIEEETIWSAPMQDIPNNTESITVTPAHMGYANIKLTNMVTVDTAKETTVTNEAYAVFYLDREPITEGKTYYARATASYSDASFSVTGLALFLNSGNGNGVDIDMNNKTSATISGIFRNYKLGIPDDTKKVSIYWYPYYDSEGGGGINRTVTTVYKRVMLIDITDLEQDYPYFASLSDEEKKALLDKALPFINGGEVLEFNGTLHNILQDPTIEKSKTYEKKVYSNKYLGCIERIVKDEFKNKIMQNDYAPNCYVRADLKINYFDETKYMLDMWQDPFSEPTLSYSEEVEPLLNKYLTVSHMRGAENSYGTYNNLMLFFRNASGEVTEDITTYSKNCLYINTYIEGSLLFFKLLGMSDDDIKTYLDSLPFFTDIYELPKEDPYIIKATAGNHTATLVLSTVKDLGDKVLELEQRITALESTLE